MVRTLAGKHPGYYEAILQLRDISPEIKLFAEDEINRASIPVTKVVKVKNGCDFYLADRQFTKALGRQLQQRFGGESTITASLVGRKDSKGVYRLTVLFRGVSFRKGDTVDYAGERYEVKAVDRNIQLQDSRTGKKVNLKYKEIGKIRKV